MKKRQFRLIHGGLSDCCRLAGVRCRVATRRTLPLVPEAVVFEEDTHLILTVDKTISYVEFNPLRLLRDLQQAKVRKPGSLVASGKNWYAVVVDLDRQPICTTDWIGEAYSHIGRRIRGEGITVIALHLLGTIHGRIPVAESLTLFVQAVRSWQPGPLKVVWLIVPERWQKEVRQLLRGHGDG